MSMTKKDYEMVAESLYNSFEDLKDFNLSIARDEFDEIQNHILDNLVMVFKQDNQNFKPDKFLKACGVYHEQIT